MARREALHRLDLAGAVDEGALEAGQVAVGVDLVAGADPAVDVEDGRASRRFVAGGADDERLSAGILMGADLVDHLRVDPRQDAGHQIGAAGRPRRRTPDQLAVDLSRRRCAHRSGRGAGSGRGRAPARHLPAGDEAVA